MVCRKINKTETNANGAPPKIDPGSPSASISPRHKTAHVRVKTRPHQGQTSVSLREKFIQKFGLYIQNFCLYKQKFGF